jgi:putative transcriptional regulator
MITKKELLQMLSNTERTESTANTDKFCQAICSFSNDIDISGSAKNGYLIHYRSQGQW